MAATQKILVLVATLALGCRSGGVEWRNHVSFRTSGRDLNLAQIDPRELITGKISRNLHYVSVALDTVFFRNLPGIGPNADVVFGFEIQGVLPDGRPVKTVPDIQRAATQNAFLSFDNMALLEPFLYTGQNITITLYFRAVASDEATSIRGRIAGAGDLLKKLNPLATTALDTAKSLFTGVLGAFTRSAQTWKYSFTLYPSDGIIRDKPDVLFTAARHILLTVPPADAPDSFRRIKPSYVIQGLKLRGNRLVWKDTEEEYTLTPYVILNVTRFKRYPKPDTELKRLVAQMTNHYENGNLPMAKSLLPSIGAAIARDPVITSTEKNLERSWKDFWETRIAAALAQKGGDREARLKLIAKQIRYLLRIKDQFRNILEPFEIKDITYKLSTLHDQGEEIAKELNKSLPEKLLTGIRQDREREKRVEAQERLAREKMLKRFAVAATSQQAESSLASTPRSITLSRSSGSRFYKKWWFWTIVGAVVAGGAAGAIAGASGGASPPSPFVVGQ